MSDVDPDPFIKQARDGRFAGAEEALATTIAVVERKPLAARTLLEVRKGGTDEDASAEPETPELGPEWVRRSAMLGHALDEAGRSRWLTADEIASGLGLAGESSARRRFQRALERLAIEMDR